MVNARAAGNRPEGRQMVRQFLKKGRENAVSLEYLASACKMSARAVRDMISDINTSGEELICSEGRGKGYFIAANIEEANAYLKYNRSYFQSQIDKERGMKRCIESKFSGQISLEVISNA